MADLPSLNNIVESLPMIIYREGKMENNQMMMKEKLEFFGIIKEAFKIPFKNPKFIFTTFLTCFPLFCFLFLHETIFHYAFIESLKSPHDGFLIIYRSSMSELDDFIKRIGDFICPKLIMQSFIIFVIIYLFDLLNTIITVSAASAIYQQEKESLTKLLPFIKNKVGLVFKGPLVTFIYALLLNFLTLIGLLTLSINIYLSTFGLIKVIYGFLFVALFTKYIEFSAIWNMGIVISILEENKRGDVALLLSAYLSRGSRKRGFQLMLVFFAWSLGLRLSSLYVGLQKGNVVIEVIVGQVCLDCFGNLMKWVTFMIYFYDCKKRYLEKKLDGGAEGSEGIA